MNPKYALLLSEPGIPQTLLEAAKRAIEKALTVAERGVALITTDHPLVTGSELSSSLYSNLTAYTRAATHADYRDGIDAGRFIDIIRTHPAQRRFSYASIGIFHGCLRTPGGVSVYDYCIENVGACVSSYRLPWSWPEDEQSDMFETAVLHAVGHVMGLALPSSEDESEYLAHCRSSSCVMANAENNAQRLRAMTEVRMKSINPFCGTCTKYLREGDYFLQERPAPSASPSPSQVF